MRSGESAGWEGDAGAAEPARARAGKPRSIVTRRAVREEGNERPVRCEGVIVPALFLCVCCEKTLGSLLFRLEACDLRMDEALTKLDQGGKTDECKDRKTTSLNNDGERKDSSQHEPILMP